MEEKKEDKITYKEEDKVTYKDIHKLLWKCRDFELSHLWQRSIFLTAFLVMCFTAYGVVLMKLLESSCHFIPINLLAFVISIVGIIFSCLWIMMGKGSKAWYEVYEKAICKFSEEEKHFIDDGVCRVAGFKCNEIDPDRLTKCLFSGKGGAYSPSRINIAIGQVSLVIWIMILIFHIILIVSLMVSGKSFIGKDFISPMCFQMIVLGIGISALIFFFVRVFCKNILWLHSNELDKNSKKLGDEVCMKLVIDFKVIKDK